MPNKNNRNYPILGKRKLSKKVSLKDTKLKRTHFG